MKLPELNTSSTPTRFGAPRNTPLAIMRPHGSHPGIMLSSTELFLFIIDPSYRGGVQQDFCPGEGEKSGASGNH